MSIRDSYGGTKRLFTEFLPRIGVAVTLCPTEDPEAIERAVAEGWGARFRPAVIPENHPFVPLLEGCFADATGRSTPVRGMPFGADMHLLVHEGSTPTVLFGPGDVRLAHAPDESVPVAELEAATRTLVLAALRFCGGVEADAGSSR